LPKTPHAATTVWTRRNPINLKGQQMTQKAIKEGLREHADEAENKISAVAERAAKTLESGIETAQDQIANVTDQASEEFRKFSETGTKFVRENPGVSMAGALGVGILLGLALRGRDY
jgi:ElaB/YqjD/DUF883 family membrane-anchored ribosome-binding protein